MKLIKPYTEILTQVDSDEVLKTIESVARTCYKSEDKITDDSARKLVSSLIKSGHDAMIEFFDITVKFVCDRGVSHEIVRHRVASYAQESTRYCNYSKDKFDSEIVFIIPSWCNTIKESTKEEQAKVYGDREVNGWYATDNSENQLVIHLLDSEITYLSLIESGWRPEQARVVLPNTLKTEINVKMNLREWRHFFSLRCAPAAHPQMRELTIPLLEKMHNLVPVIFDDLYEKYCK